MFLFGMCLADYTDSCYRTRFVSVGLVLLKYRVTQFAPDPCSFLHFTTKHSPKFRLKLKETVYLKVAMLCFFTAVTHALYYF